MAWLYCFSAFVRSPLPRSARLCPMGNKLDPVLEFHAPRSTGMKAARNSDTNMTTAALGTLCTSSEDDVRVEQHTHLPPCHLPVPNRQTATSRSGSARSRQLKIVITSWQVLDEPAAERDLAVRRASAILPPARSHSAPLRADALRAFLARKPQDFGEPRLRLGHCPGSLLFDVHGATSLCYWTTLD